jgi:hypothetical protein
MTALEALAILESAVLECKKRSVDTPEVHEALTLLEPHIQPEWLVQQFRHHALKARGEKLFEREGQQQVLRPSFEASMNLKATSERLSGVNGKIVGSKLGPQLKTQEDREILPLQTTDGGY